MAYVPWSKDGCTLAEARERTADRALWKEWQQCLEECKSFGPPPSYWEGCRVEETIRQERLENRTHARAQELEERVSSAFFRHMQRRQLVAYGRPGSLNGAPQFIAPDVLPALTEMGWKESALAQRAGGAFCAVRVYPALVSPSRAELLAGQTFRDVVRTFVLQDPEYVALSSQAEQHSPRTGELTPSGEPVPQPSDWRWPTDPAPFPDLPSFLRTKRSFYEQEPAKDEQWEVAYAVLWHRYLCLLDAIQKKEIIVKGTSVQSGSRTEIDAAEWCRQSAQIDVLTGDFLDLHQGKLNQRWTALTFEKPQPTVVAAAADPIRRGHDVGGTPAKYPWDFVIDRVLIRFGEKGIPESKTEFIRWVQELATTEGPTGPQMPDERTVREFLLKRVPAAYQRAGKN